eukprot:GHVN01019085.1.p2 GENE.GHVN01019085.1~~GHVN01019085.1.p2  ORF type:complete len:263 (+),score=9.95 GHVN01019085.1:2366-3154(+)
MFGLQPLKRVAPVGLHRGTYAQQRFAGMKPGPSWSATPKQGPVIRDNSVMVENQRYSGLTLYLRGIRPYAEKLAADTIEQVKAVVVPMSQRAKALFLRYNPDLYHQLFALGGFTAVCVLVESNLAKQYQKLMDMKHLLSLSVARDYDNLGFWRSRSEDVENRVQSYSDDHARLESLWESALYEATTSRSFDHLVEKLEVDEDEIEAGVPSPMTCRDRIASRAFDKLAFVSKGGLTCFLTDKITQTPKPSQFHHTKSLIVRSL